MKHYNNIAVSNDICIDIDIICLNNKRTQLLLIFHYNNPLLL